MEKNISHYDEYREKLSKVNFAIKLPFTVTCVICFVLSMCIGVMGWAKFIASFVGGIDLPVEKLMLITFILFVSSFIAATRNKAATILTALLYLIFGLMFVIYVIPIIVGIIEVILYIRAFHAIDEYRNLESIEGFPYFNTLIDSPKDFALDSKKIEKTVGNEKMDEIITDSDKNIQ